jgi:hypothetical protein
MANITRQDGNGNGGGTDRALKRAERGVLGGMLRDNAVIPAVLQVVSAEDYYADANQRVHRAIGHLHAEGKLADAVTVADVIRARGEVDDIGGYAYLGDLLRAAPTAPKALHYAAVVRRRSTTRRLIRCLQGHLARADNCRPPEEQAADVIRDMETVLSRTPAPDGDRPRRSPVATIDDLRQAGADISWVWLGWIQRSVLTGLAAEAGIGKTRFCADLVRRILHQLPWPDGQAMTLPRDTKVLWVAADNHHGELVELCVSFDIGDVVRLNADQNDPYGGTSLHTAEELRAFEARIREVKPALVFVDTVGNATDRDLCKQEEAKAFYEPLQQIARRQRCAIVCNTHLNAGGQFLGRRVLEKVRTAIRMEQTDPGSTRRRLEVVKSNSRIPPPLGLTMGDKGNDYDGQPPQRPEGNTSGRIPAKLTEAMDWLKAELEKGPRQVQGLRDAAEQKGFPAGTLYNAKDTLGAEEFTAERRKWWRLTTAD